MGFSGRRDPVVLARNLRRLIATHIRVERLKQMRTPLHVIVTDVLTGEDVRLSYGSAVGAVLASAAIPAVFSLVMLDGRRLMDGGVANNTPISHAVELGADEIYVLPTGDACAQEAPHAVRWRCSCTRRQSSSGSACTSRSSFTIDRASLVVLPPPCPLDVQPIDFPAPER